MGEEFDLVMKTRNLHMDPIRLDSIDVDFAFLEGFEVISITPTPEEPMDIFGQRSWAFTDTVAAGDSLDVVFTLKAVREGHYVGDIDVCNPNQDFTTVIPNIDVLAD